MPDAATNITVSSVHDPLLPPGTRFPTFISCACSSSPFWLSCRSPSLRCGSRRIFSSGLRHLPWGMVFVTLGATLASWTVMVTAWQVFLYGPERFHNSGSFRLVLPCLGNYPRAWALARFRLFSLTRHSYRDVRIQERRHLYVSAIAAGRAGRRGPRRRHFGCRRPVQAAGLVRSQACHRIPLLLGPGFQKDWKIRSLRAITWRSGHSAVASSSTWPSASENSSA